MEDFVTTVKLFSADKNWTSLLEYVNRSYDTLIKNVSKIDAAISSFEPEECTIATTELLHVKISLPNCGDFEMLFSQVQQLIRCVVREQLTFVTHKFARICHFIANCLLEKKEALRGIAVMENAIKAMQLTPLQLTSIHTDLFKLCLAAKCLKPALPYLDTNIASIEKENGAYDAEFYLLYCYYGGMILNALKDFDKALFYFEAGVTTPALAVSHIMLETYKKYLIVSTLLHGKIGKLPKYTSNVVERFLKPLSMAYFELATACANHNADAASTIANKHHHIFQRDQNVGLIKQLLASVYKKNIHRLTKTFLTLSLSDMATRVHLASAAEAERHLLNMIEDGDINASINHRNGMVSFHDNIVKYDTPEVFREIDKEMKVCIALDQKLQSMDNNLSVNPQYMKRAVGLAQLDEAGKADDLLM